MISFDAALAILVAEATPLATESVALDAAHGRVLAEPCIAQVDAPRSDISVMDGYALRDADLALGAPFRVIGAAYPGTAFEGRVEAGTCVRLFTGAPLPQGADRVVVQEDVARNGDAMRVVGTLSGKRYIRPHGSDFRAGETLLDAGTVLGPRALVAAAGADMAMLPVWRRPRLSVISTGDELAEPGGARARVGSIPESASYGAAALGAAWGAEVVGRYRLRDDIAELTAGATESLDEADVVVVTGGASVGEKDYAKQIFVSLGTEILFSRIAIMPGKPVWFGRRGAQFVLGLPGNPSSAMVTARLFLTTLLAGLSGRAPADALRWRSARLMAPLDAASARETFVRARCDEGGVVSLANQDSGLQRALAEADVLIRRMPHAEAAPTGTLVSIIDF
ncbi:molybdopterin molybdotransferase MoeA [Sphingomonas sp. PAMC 26605]|uniref:molybdopterin molybdotransferase MoeA n=1 Tax=Sphingomonas sp. PAMC 26605 TaxID=1112214 RepID=UPI00026CD115|nr:molybdopterin molybdotransferase MoeA [Sphingomonas sp. PAMC 26605]